MPKAYWKGFEIYQVEYKKPEGWCTISFKMGDYLSPITGTGCQRVWPEDIEIRWEEK